MQTDEDSSKDHEQCEIRVPMGFLQSGMFGGLHGLRQLEEIQRGLGLNMVLTDDDYNLILKLLIKEKKSTGYVKGYDASEPETLGRLIASHFKWDGERIFQTMLSAFEDANFHAFNREMSELWKRMD